MAMEAMPQAALMLVPAQQARGFFMEVFDIMVAMGYST
jgi:hypothetical protein